MLCLCLFDFLDSNFSYFLINFFIKLKAEASQIEQDMHRIEQEINSAHLNVARSFCCPYYICFKYTNSVLCCLMLHCLPFRLKEEEKKLAEALWGINKSIGDIEKEVNVCFFSIG